MHLNIHQKGRWIEALLNYSKSKSRSIYWKGEFNILAIFTDVKCAHSPERMWMYMGVGISLSEHVSILYICQNITEGQSST